MKTFPTILLTAILAAAATWLTVRQIPASPPAAATAASGERKLHFYQCSMHPQVTSDKPGRCTICGMELTPIYDGESGSNASSGGNVVALSQSQIQVLHVQTSEATIRPLSRTLRVAGAIAENASRHRVLAASVDGRIDTLHVNFLGEEIAAGQPLAEFYSPGLLQAEREYRQLGGELRKNTALRLRQMGLAPAQIDALDNKSADSLTSQILAPVSGTVVVQAVYAGQYVTTGERMFEIADFSTMWFMFRAYEQDLPWLKTGLIVRVTTPALPGKTFSGSITFIDPNIDAATRSACVRVELPNPLVNGKRELLNRLYADGSVELDAPSVLTVPRSAVIETGPEAVVYVEQTSGAYERRVVKIGRRGDTYQEILSGVKAGERVVTNGNLLIDGQAEMNRAFMAPAAPVTPPAQAPATAFSGEQTTAIAGFVKVADAMAAALAADDLTGFNNAAQAAMDATEVMVKQLRPNINNGAALEALDGARHFHGIDDLKSARLAFHKFSVAATAVLGPLRKAGGTPNPDRMALTDGKTGFKPVMEDSASSLSAPETTGKMPVGHDRQDAYPPAKRTAAGDFPEFQVYECGMVDQAIPGVPKKARWIQTGGRALKNPFFGKAMPDCGEEIQP